jgi:hypothetical protein
MTWHLPRIGNEAFEVSRFLGSPMLHLSGGVPGVIQVRAISG